MKYLLCFIKFNIFKPSVSFVLLGAIQSILFYFFPFLPVLLFPHQSLCVLEAALLGAVTKPVLHATFQSAGCCRGHPRSGACSRGIPRPARSWPGSQVVGVAAARISLFAAGSCTLYSPAGQR